MNNEDLISEELLASIQPSLEEFVARRIRNNNFAKVIVWMSVRSRNDDFVYVKELMDFMKYSRQRASIVLDEMASNGLLAKKKIGDRFVEYWYKRDENGKAILCEFFKRAKRTLGLKVKVSFE